MKLKKRFFKILISLLLLSFIFVDGANAFYTNIKNITGNFLSTATLGFSLKDVSNNPLHSPFFSMGNIKPGDSRPQIIRVQKDGNVDYEYMISFAKTNGDDVLCSALQIEAKFEGVTKYAGSLSSLSISPVTNTGSHDDWDFTVSLNDTSPSLINKICEFNLIFNGWQTNSDGTWGFTDQHSAGNTVTTGTWEVGSAVDQNQNSQPDTLQLDLSGQEGLKLDASDYGSVQNQDNLSATPSPTPTVDDATTPTETPTPTPTPTSAAEQSSNSGQSSSLPNSDQLPNSDNPPVLKTNVGG